MYGTTMIGTLADGVAADAIRSELEAWEKDALSDDPRQEVWWREHFAPLLSGEPRWIDGAWVN